MEKRGRSDGWKLIQPQQPAGPRNQEPPADGFSKAEDHGRKRVLRDKFSRDVKRDVGTRGEEQATEGLSLHF